MAVMSRIHRKLFTANANNYDSFIGIGQINILKEIINHERITQDELAGVLNLDKTTVAKAVKRLETHGLITRNQSETDLRKKELVATQKALAVKERMNKHLKDNNRLIFDGVTEQELDIFINVLKKIETNIEKKRKLMKEKKQLGMKIVKLIEKNEGITTEKLAELLGKKVEEIKEIIEKLIMKEFVEENSGVLSITQKIKTHKKEHIMVNKEDKRRKGGHEEHAKIFKFILQNSGISKDELAQKLGKSAAEISSVLKHFESKGVVEIKDGKLYANKEALKERHKG